MENFSKIEHPLNLSCMRSWLFQPNALSLPLIHFKSIHALNYGALPSFLSGTKILQNQSLGQGNNIEGMHGEFQWASKRERERRNFPEDPHWSLSLIPPAASHNFDSKRHSLVWRSKWKVSLFKTHQPSKKNLKCPSVCLSPSLPIHPRIVNILLTQRLFYFIVSGVWCVAMASNATLVL